jgi:condensin complex subunit 2
VGQPDYRQHPQSLATAVADFHLLIMTCSPIAAAPAAAAAVLQVDVRALKDLLWDSLITVNTHKASQDNSSSMESEEERDDSTTAAAAAGGGSKPPIPFQEVIISVPEQSAAGSLEDVSVHMCFICLLHLANEKGLVIKAKEDLKTLTISNVN